MGCDIHLYVEKKINGVWTSQDKWHTYSRAGWNYATIEYADRFYSERNYDLFAILANVRNGYGFAFTKTGGGLTPIALPKGVPSDVSLEVLRDIEEWSGDGHSHSYFTLKELLEYDWTKVTNKEGYVSLESWLRWTKFSNKTSGPDAYASMVSGAGITHVTEQQAYQLLESDEISLKDKPWHDCEALCKNNPGTFVHITWNEPYYSRARGFLSTALPKLLALSDGLEGASDVRIVFFFDN